MKRLLPVLALWLAASGAQAALRVFACEPEWAALAGVLGGDQVEIYAATTARQDPHRIQARPSLIAQLRQADLLVCTGADLEAGWLPVLLRQARNPAVQPGQPGHFLVADTVALLEVPRSVDRVEGDVHPQGNPHVQLDPRRIGVVASALGRRLAELDTANAATYATRTETFQQRWQQAIAEWGRRAAPLRGRRFVVHHVEWTYLFDWLGLETAGAIEPKPGLPPAAGHLALLKDQLAARPADGIVRSPLSDPKAVDWLAGATGLPVIELPHTVGATNDAGDLQALFDAIIRRLSESGR
jgi:zinc/manganese transport system substrate-binding protein